MSQFFQSKSQKKLPYQGKKAKWYTWASLWPKTDKQGNEDDEVFDIVAYAPSKSKENEDGSPRACDILAAAVTAWQNGSEEPLRMKLFLNVERTGRQPWMRIKVGEETFATLCEAAGMSGSVDDQPIQEPEEEPEVKPTKNLFKK